MKMLKVVTQIIAAFATLLGSTILAQDRPKTLAEQQYPEQMTAVEGKFQPTWASLRSYKIPEWYRDAKFGLWAHWGPQCQPEYGDWYARGMYQQINQKGEPNDQYKYHLKQYGHPSKFGFKEVINTWKAENWDPDRIVALCKRAGAEYFVAMANHHDNFDTWDSKYQPWNSVKIGPKKDLIGGWAAATRRQGLRFGVSVHAARTWHWFDFTQTSDTTGPMAGIPYDGKLTAADGKGTWWEGLDPQDLYAQNHPIGQRTDAPYQIKFFNRTMDLVEKYRPDLIYFDDSILPFYGTGNNMALQIAAQYYNRNMRWHGGKLDAVINGKGLKGDQLNSLVNDIERGKSDKLEPLPWQTCSCIGDWHYKNYAPRKQNYSKPEKVAASLVDIVSKNGNLLLSIPMKGDGFFDDEAITFLQTFGTWMDVVKEGIIATRPWRVYGEGPSTIVANQTKGENGGITDFQRMPFTPEDIRFTTSKNGSYLYAFFMVWPEDTLNIQSLAKSSPHGSETTVASLSLLGSNEKLKWKQSETGLQVTLPKQMINPGPWSLKISLLR